MIRYQRALVLIAFTPTPWKYILGHQNPIRAVWTLISDRWVDMVRIKTPRPVTFFGILAQLS